MTLLCRSLLEKENEMFPDKTKENKSFFKESKKIRVMLNRGKDGAKINYIKISFKIQSKMLHVVLLDEFICK